MGLDEITQGVSAEKKRTSSRTNPQDPFWMQCEGEDDDASRENEKNLRFYQIENIADIIL